MFRKNMPVETTTENPEHTQYIPPQGPGTQTKTRSALAFGNADTI